MLGVGLARVGGPRDLRALGAATIVTHRLQTIFVGAEHTDGTLRTKTDTASGEVTTYDYDALGNLRSVELPDTRYIEYLVDGAQRRVGRRVFDAGGTLTDEVHWLYQDALNPVTELDAQGRVRKRFVYGSKGHIPDYMVTYDVCGVETGSYRLVSDHLGSVRLVVDLSDGTVAQRMTYDAFGNVLDDTNEGFQPFGFAGGLYDSITGLVRFGARDYDARVGRWTAKDPIGFGGGDTDLYAYVAGDPVNYIDPSGMVIDTVLDIGFIGYDLYRIGADNIIGDCDNLGSNLAALGLDVGGALIPFVTGAGAASRAARTACFVAGTPVLLCDDTTQPIDEIEPGDTVWSRDPETGEFGCREVVALKITPEQRVLSVEVSTFEGGSEIFGVTAEHPFRVVGEGWKPAEELKPGDEIFTSAGGWMRVTGSTWQAHTQTVYNFEVADFHTYFVGDGGAWVHNVCDTLANRILNAERKHTALHKSDLYHRSASFVDINQIKAGKSFPNIGNDGVERTLVQTDGVVNGEAGIFEWIIDIDGKIPHQMFRRGGSVTGKFGGL